ncbi:MAG: RES family NAD+ phosphorylase [Pseudomonadota bacterium]
MRLTSVNDRALVRLISETHHKPPVLRGLVDTAEEEEVLAQIEGETSARRIAEREGGPALDRRELAFARRSLDLRLYGQSHINAAFTYTRPSGNRFNAGDRGAWYCAWNMLTSAQEVGYHRTRELGFIGRYEDEARYVELLADFIGDFPDLHDRDPRGPDSRGEAHPALDPTVERGYPAGQHLAAALRAEGHRGLIYPSVRHRGGRCFVAFDPGIIQNVRPGARWKLVWQGTPEFSIEGL